MPPHSPVTKPLAAHGHKRNESRARVAVEARIQTVLGTFSGYLLNVSCHGAMVQLSSPPQKGSDVILHCGPLDVMGKVAWSVHERFGMEFDDALEEHLVVELRRQADEAAKHVAHQRLGRPALVTRALTAEEWAVAQEWAGSSNFR